MALTKITYSMVEGAAANVKDYGAVGNGIADDTAAIQAALNANLNVYLPPTGNSYKITAPLVIPNARNVYMDGANILSTVAGIFRFASGATSAIHAARSVLQTNTVSAGAAISLVDNATTIAGVSIYGFPLIIAANTIVDNDFRGIDMSGFYRSYLEVQVNGFYFGIYADGDGGGTLATYYNVLMKPDIRCGDQGYAIWLQNLVNATSIVSPFISGGGQGFGGIVIDDNSGSNSVLGGYIEGFAANVGSVGIRLSDAFSNTIVGVTLDQDGTDTTGNYALELQGTSAGNSFINLSFAGAWNDSSRLLLNNASGKNSFIGNGYTNAYVFGQAGASLVNEGLFASQINSATTSASVTFPSVAVSRGAEGLLLSTVVDDGITQSGYSGIYFGEGSPEGVYTARAGSIFMRRDGGANTCFYVKELDTGNTGWVAK